MKKIFSLAILAMALVFTGCDQNKPDNYADYPQLIVGKWFNFTPEESVFMNFNQDKTVYVVGYDKVLGWLENSGKYLIEEGKVIRNYLIEGE